MNNAVLALLVLALTGANLPFLIERRLWVLPPSNTGEKVFAWRLVEWLVLYFLIGWIARLLEGRFAPPQHQDWEFYAVTACAFAVMAFPGFIYRYLWRPHL